MFKIESTMTLNRSYTFRIKKSDNRENSADQQADEIKFHDWFIERDQIDQVLQQPKGWAKEALFDDAGTPRFETVMSLTGRSWLVTGTLGDGKRGGTSVQLTKATLDSVTLTLTELGAVLSGTITWEGAGDEAEDLREMVGKQCTFKAQLGEAGKKAKPNGKQKDLVEETRAS